MLSVDLDVLHVPDLVQREGHVGLKAQDALPGVQVGRALRVFQLRRGAAGQGQHGATAHRHIFHTGALVRLDLLELHEAPLQRIIPVDRRGQLKLERRISLHSLTDQGGEYHMRRALE